jgi:hypothetical protein
MESIPLALDELRAVTAYAASCAQDVLDVFERAHPGDARPREAVEAAWAFAQGGPRNKRLRDTAWAAQKAAGEAGATAAGEAARAALAAAGAAYLHPLAKATQVKHILGAAIHSVRAATDHAEQWQRARQRATPVVIEVLERYPPAPDGGGRTGELMRRLDGELRRLDGESRRLDGELRTGRTGPKGAASGT